METLVDNWDQGLKSALASKKIFLTGHTGFKGSWLLSWLKHYDCQVTGYSLSPDTAPCLFDLANLKSCLLKDYRADIRDAKTLSNAMMDSAPEVVIHMAAQSLVRYSYDNPLQTWETNVIGTVNVLEAVRSCPSVKAVVIITTDKCYDNREWSWGYREIDPLGGHDPYSASKAGTELVVNSYRKSFFHKSKGPLIASVRAGNVIGGGDWSKDRLIPDAARATANNEILMIRNARATRPWQHVLDCLAGYMMVVAGLLEGREDIATAFNFGPAPSDNLPVDEMLEKLQKYWPELMWHADSIVDSSLPHEANFLYLDSMKAQQQLAWKTRWSLDDALHKTADWYRAVIKDPQLAQNMIQQQLNEYLES